MAKPLPSVVATNPENDPPEVARRDAIREHLLRNGPKGKASTPAVLDVARLSDMTSLPEGEDKDPEGEINLGEMHMPPLEITNAPLPAPPAAVAHITERKFHVVLKNDDFVLRFTTTLFSVSDHAVGVMLDKKVFTFEPKLAAEYKLVCLPNESEEYRVFYAGGYLDMKDAKGSVLLLFMRVEA